MLAYIQISRRNKSNYQFHKLFRNSFRKRYNSIKQYQPGDIIGAVLYPGYINEQQYKSISDEANQQYLSFYKKTLKRSKKIHCYPIIAIVPFAKPIKGITYKANIAALKINDILLKQLKAALGNKRLLALQYLCKQYDITKDKSIEHRILILQKSHAINTLLGLKSAEFRTIRLGDKFAARFRTKKDVNKLLKYKKHICPENVQKLKTFVSKLK